jgi:hypothetical protein
MGVERSAEAMLIPNKTDQTISRLKLLWANSCPPLK